MSLRARLLALLVAASAVAPSALRADDAGSEAAAAEAPAKLGAKLDVKLARDEIAVGELAELTITIDAPTGAEVAFPEQPLGPLEQVKRDVTTREENGRTITTFALGLLALEPGEVTIPALDLRVIGQNGELEHLRSDAKKVTVSSRIANEPNAEPKPATAPVVVVQDDYTLAWVGLAVFGAALVALTTLYVSRWLKARPKPPVPLPPPRPPWEIALEELSVLAGQKTQLLAEERGEVFVDRVSDTLRAYLGRRYGFDGLESTTAEVVTTLEQIRPDKLSLSGVSLLLEQCDLVKFARATPDEEQCEDLFNGALGLVRATTPEPRVRTPESDAPRTPGAPGPDAGARS
ncbi:MAG: BatD family protein [Polyangiales bacterium]